jgi:hypothetical protein
VGGCRRELLDHVIPLNEERFRRLIRDYICYFHQDRIHDGLGKDTPNRTRPGIHLRVQLTDAQNRYIFDSLESCEKLLTAREVARILSIRKKVV